MRRLQPTPSAVTKTMGNLEAQVRENPDIQRIVKDMVKKELELELKRGKTDQQGSSGKTVGG